MKRIKITLGFWLLLLSGVAMLVTNFVVLPFWAGDILARETRHLTRMLATLPPPTSLEEQQALPLSLQALLEDSADGCASWHGAAYPGYQEAAACFLGLQPLVAVAAQTGTIRTSLSESGAPFSLLTAKHLYVAVPLTLPGKKREGIGLGIPLSTNFP